MSEIERSPEFHKWMDDNLKQMGFTEDSYVGLSQKWRDDNGDATFRLDYDLNEDSLVLDVGGYLGNWAQDIYCKHKCKVHVYEPIQEFYDIIKSKFSNNHDVKIFKYGLGNMSVDDIPMADIGDATSFYKSNTEDSELVRIVDVVQEIKLKKRKIDLMKLNIEGSEYSLIERLIDTGDIKKIKNLQVQFHMFIKNYEYRRDMIREKLSETHKLTYDYPFIWENWEIK